MSAAPDASSGSCASVAMANGVGATPPRPPPPSIHWIRTLPKIELHAHLSGSVREETVRALLDEEASRGDSSFHSLSSEMRTFHLGDRDLAQCFQVFRLLHRLLANLATLARVTREVVADMARDGVAYVELRTTPRALPPSQDRPGSSAREYVQTVVESIREAENSVRRPDGGRIVVRLLLSIDRSQGLQAAESTLALATEFASHPKPVVVGLDFSGNPTVGTFRDYLPLFQRAREAGLRASVHVGEKVDDDEDMDAALQFRPERLGHVVCLAPRHVQALLANPLPIEICPTSNLKTQIVTEWKAHPFGVWRSKGRNNQTQEQRDQAAAAAAAHVQSHYPMSVCTDDSGVFNITLSSELAQLSHAFGMDARELFEMQRRAIEFTFCDDATKQQLREIMDQFERTDSTLSPHSAASSPSLDARPVAILTCSDESYDKASDRALMGAFARHGRSPAVHVVWEDERVEWSAFRAVLIRTVWDYHISADHTRRFLQLLHKLEAQGLPVLNSASCVEWNARKSYLRSLAGLGVPTLPTLWIEHLASEASGLQSRAREQGWSDVVLKPLVSASGFHTRRCNVDDESFAATLDRCIESGIDAWMLQPFANEVVQDGELSFVFLGGVFSHALLARPRESKGEKDDTSFMVQAEYGGERILLPDPPAELLQQAEAALRASPFGAESTYARVDGVRRAAADGSVQLLLTELELIEPELFGFLARNDFERRFVDVVEAKLQAHANKK